MGCLQGAMLAWLRRAPRKGASASGCQRRRSLCCVPTHCPRAPPASRYPLPQAVLRLLAHAYTFYLMHLTSGGRIAAAAAAKLDLAAADALAFYKCDRGPVAGACCWGW